MEKKFITVFLEGNQAKYIPVSSILYVQSRFPCTDADGYEMTLINGEIIRKDKGAMELLQEIGQLSSE